MNESVTSGRGKSLLTTLALVAAAAGPAYAQPNDDKAPPPPPADTAAPPPPPAAPLLAAPQYLEPPPAPPPNGNANGNGKPMATEEMPKPAEIPGGTAPGETTFKRPPLKVTIGSGNNAFSFTLFGIVQADYLADTTRSYDEPIGPVLVARSDTYEGTVGRTMATMRSSRLGFVLDAPTFNGITPSAVLQGDWAGNQPGNPY